MNSRKLIDRDFFCEYDLLIISPGGSCQSYIMNEIIKQKSDNYYINNLNDEDNLKHCSSYKNSLINCNKIKRVLYIFNNTLLSILSHFNRNWYEMQYRKISTFVDFNENHLFNDKNLYFDEVIKMNKDISNISKHFYNWINYPQNIYFLNLSNSYNEQDLNHFLGFNLKLKINNNLRIFHENIPDNIINFYKNIDNDIIKIIIDKNLKYHEEINLLKNNIF